MKEKLFYAFFYIYEEVGLDWLVDMAILSSYIQSS